MQRKELIKAIKNAPAVYGFVCVTNDDGKYIRLYKSDLIQQLGDNAVSYNAEITDDGTIYIN